MEDPRPLTLSVAAVGSFRVCSIKAGPGSATLLFYMSVNKVLLFFTATNTPEFAQLDVVGRGSMSGSLFS